MNEINKPAYYAVIPSGVRYCKELKFAERLLYGEITALTNRNGYCFATNKYFAELYNVTIETISRWISHLQRLGFIKIEIIKSDKNEIIERRIFIIDNSNNTFLTNTYCQNNQYPCKQNNQYPIDEKVKENNINIRIDRFFYFIINKERKAPEKLTKIQTAELYELLEKLELNYTKEFLKIVTEENIEKLKIVIYALKELVINKKGIFTIKRENLLSLYDKCKRKQASYIGTEKEIGDFFEYYYISLVKELEKAR